jgi:hypothetical protein
MRQCDIRCNAAVAQPVHARCVSGAQRRDLRGNVIEPAGGMPVEGYTSGSPARSRVSSGSSFPFPSSRLSDMTSFPFRPAARRADALVATPSPAQAGAPFTLASFDPAATGRAMHASRAAAPA